MAVRAHKIYEVLIIYFNNTNLFHIYTKPLDSIFLGDPTLKYVFDKNLDSRKTHN